MCTCEFCGESLKNAIPIRSQFTRFCWYCLKENPWTLDKDQKPVGYGIDKDLEKGFEDV